MFEYQKFFNYLYRKSIIKGVINHINRFIVIMFAISITLILLLFSYVRFISVNIFNTPTKLGSEKILACLVVLGILGCIGWFNDLINPTRKFSLNKKIFCYFNVLIYYIKEREQLSLIKEIFSQLYINHLVLNLESRFAELKNNINNLFIINPDSEDCKILSKIEEILFPKLRAFSKIQYEDRKKIIMIIESILNLYCYKVDILEDTHKSNLSEYISSSENNLKQETLMLIEDIKDLPEKENKNLICKITTNKYSITFFFIIIFVSLIFVQNNYPTFDSLISKITTYIFGAVSILHILFNSKWFNDNKNK